MLIRSKPGWALPEAVATPESVYLNRRALIQAAALPLISAVAGSLAASAAPAAESDPGAGRYPAARNLRHTLDRPLTDELSATTYNNFVEFGSQKEIYKQAQGMPVRPWTVTIDGLVEAKRTVDVDALLASMPLEERLYRHRCVEAWAMAVPWTGFPLKALVEFARPLDKARYVTLQTFKDPSIGPGQKQFWYPWPYTEGLSLAEATHELAFIATGLYGKPLKPQNGAPLRLAVPWKYGFKSIKSIVRLTFSEERPVNFWQRVQASEYGFWANVNPEVPHPRWSQATERMLGIEERRPTQIFNGYGEFVAPLYADLPGEKLFR